MSYIDGGEGIALYGPECEYIAGLGDEAGPINDEHNGGIPEMVSNDE